jgi:hypothetical protein
VMYGARIMLRPFVVLVVLGGVVLARLCRR